MPNPNPNPSPSPSPNPNPTPHEVNIIVFCFGTLVAYTVTVGDILRPVLQMCGGWAWMQSCFNSTMSLGQVAAVILFWGGLMLPLSLVDKMF